MASAPAIEKKTIKTESFDPLGTSTWTALPEEKKQEIFALDFESPTIDDQLRRKIEELHLEGVNPTDIEFFHSLENDIEEKQEAAEEKQEEHVKKHTVHNDHNAPHHAHQFEPSFHEAYSTSELYRTIFQKEVETFKQKFQKKYKRPPTQAEIVANVYTVSEAKFKKQDPKTARMLEEKEKISAQAKNSSQDVIAKQYQQQAAITARNEIANKKLKTKLKKGTISKEEYKKQANEIYNKHKEHWDIKFAEQFQRKAGFYAVVRKESRYLAAIKTIRIGKEKKKQKKKSASTQQKQSQFSREEIIALATLKNNPTQLTPKQKELLAMLKNRAGVHNEIKAEIAKLEKTAQKGPQQKKQIAATKKEDKEEETSQEKNNSSTSIQDIYKQIRESLERENTFEKFGSEGEGFSEQIPTENLGNGVESGDFSALDANSVEGSLAPEATASEAAATEAAAATTAGAEGAAAASATAGATGAVVGVEGTAAATAGGTALLANPITWIVIAVILVIILLVVILMMIFNHTDTSTNANNIPGFTMTIDGPDNVPNGTTNTLNYTINITYTLFDTIQITNPIPAGAVCAPGPGYTCNGNNDIVWNLDNVKPIQTNGDSKIYQIPVSFTVAPTTKNTNINEVVTADDLTTANSSNPVPGLTLTVKTSPATVANGEIFDYVIDATYTGNDPSVQIFAKVPPHTQLLGQPTGPKVTNVNGLITWVLSDYGKKAEFLYRVKPDSTLNDTVLTNTVYATSRGTGTGGNIAWLDSAPGNPQFNGNGDGWVTAQCSQASLAEIFNSYKNPSDPQLKIADVEAYGQSIGVWNPTDGLVFQPTAEASIAKEVDHFGFKIQSYNTYNTLTNPIPTDASLGEVINIANQGHPVMISAPNHWLVLWKGDATKVDLLDSSPWNLTWAPNEQNIEISRHDMINGLYDIRSKVTDSSLWYGYWTGIAVVIVPK